MLWQPSLPDEYLRASPDALAERITARRRELGDKLVILGHHYQTDEIIRHADFTGDSLKLSQLAAEKVRERGAQHVVFCGVHFMAETADLLTPDAVNVILPDLSAGCSMADMADYDDALAAWETLHATLRSQGWNGRIIPITYINSTAAIKALVGMHGGIVCTSSNAAKVFEWAMNGGTEPLNLDEPDERHSVDPSEIISANVESSMPHELHSASGVEHAQNGHAVDSTNAESRMPNADSPASDIKILFLPDQHLGRNTAAKYGLDVETQTAVFDPRRVAKGESLGGMTPDELLRAKVILWAGHCSVHKLFRPEHCDQARAQDANVKILVHPECCKEVVDKADLSGSTEYILKTIRNAEPGTSWAIGTEVHLVTRLAKEAVERDVKVRILSDCQCLCTTMYRIDQPHLCWALDNLAKGKVVNRIVVPSEARKWALVALERMLSLSASPAPMQMPVQTLEPVAVD